MTKQTTITTARGVKVIPPLWLEAQEAAYPARKNPKALFQYNLVAMHWNEVQYHLGLVARKMLYRLTSYNRTTITVEPRLFRSSKTGIKERLRSGLDKVSETTLRRVRRKLMKLGLIGDCTRLEIAVLCDQADGNPWLLMPAEVFARVRALDPYRGPVRNPLGKKAEARSLRSLVLFDRKLMKQWQGDQSQVVDDGPISSSDEGDGYNEIAALVTTKCIAGATKRLPQVQPNAREKGSFH